MKRVGWLVVVSSVLVGAQVASAGGLVPEPVLTGAANRYLASADDEHLVWTEQARKKPAVARMRKVDSGGVGRVINDAHRGYSFSGGFNDGELLYQQARNVRRSSRSDLRVFDPATRDYHAPPAGINTELWEWRGTWSDGYVLFGRNSFQRKTAPWRVILYDRATGQQKVLDTVTYKCACIWPGDVTDQYATWTICKRSCKVLVYDIGADTTTKAPNPGNKQNYLGSVTTDGSLYYGHSGNGCGVSVKIYRWTIGDPGAPVVIASMPAHIELGYNVSAFIDADMHTDVYFDRFDCRKREVHPDVYVIHDAETGRRRAERSSTGDVSSKHPSLVDAKPRSTYSA